MMKRQKMNGCAPGGFTYLELVAVILIVSLLFIVAAWKFQHLKVDAERVAFEQTASAVRSAVALQMAEYIVRDDFDRIVGMVGSNPVDYLAEVPGNYAGEVRPADQADIEGGRWYFDKKRHFFCYNARYADDFRSSNEDEGVACFAIRMLYDDRNDNGSFDEDTDDFNGLQFVSLDGYQWFEKPLPR